MKRRAPHEQVESFRYRKARPRAEQLQTLLEVWADEHTDALADVEPDLPAELTDRAADCWEALVAIADYVGGRWPARARQAAVALHAQRTERDPSLGVRLLADLRAVFGDRDYVFTDDLLASLTRMDKAPWGDLYGKSLDAIGLARRLRKYQVRPKSVRIGAVTAKGYARTDLHDPWVRYLPSPSQPVTPVTPVTDDDADDWETRYAELFEVEP